MTAISWEQAQAGKGGVPYLTPGEAGYRLDKLRDAWNALRNDVWPGTAAFADVPRDLAARVDERWAAWRAWYDDAAKSLYDAVVPIAFGSEFARGLDAWTDEYGHLQREVVAAVLASGSGRELKAPGLAPVLKSRVPDLATVLVFAGIGVFVLGGFWVWLRRPRR